LKLLDQPEYPASIKQILEGGREAERERKREKERERERETQKIKYC
jgi:hypothetical protein